MGTNIFSVLMTIWWSSVLIVLFYFLRTRTGLLHVCSISTVILLYLFCAIRIVLPIELSWTYVVSGGEVYNVIYSVLAYKIGFARLYELFFVIWMIGTLCILSGYLIMYHRVIIYIRSIQKAECKACRQILDELDKGKRIEVIKTTAVKSPCCLGVFKKRILLPDKEYNRDELRYILLHEYTHLCNNDILLMVLIKVLCGIYWWNPVVYLLRKELNQSMEIRCDLSVAGHLNENERADYLSVMLDTFRESRKTNKLVGVAGLVESHPESLLERFQIVADMGVVQKNRANMFAGLMMLLLLTVSYSFILQSKYETPVSEIETDKDVYEVDEENSYIIKQGDTYILHTASTEIIISEETLKMLVEEGFTVEGGNR